MQKIEIPEVKRRSLLGLGLSYLGLKVGNFLLPNKHLGKPIFVSKKIDPTGLNPEVYKNTTFKQNSLGFF